MSEDVPLIVTHLRRKYPAHLLILRASPTSLVYPPDLYMAIPVDDKVVEGLIASRLKNGWPLLVVEDVWEEG